MPRFYLASKSPRRLQILKDNGVSDFEVLPVGKTTPFAYEGDEERLPGEAARDYVTRTAKNKALEALTRIKNEDLPYAPVLAADTAVVLDETILGKPKDVKEELSFLKALSGKTHIVRTHVALTLDENTIDVIESVSEISFRLITQEEMTEYAAMQEPYDKAGGYAIQGYAKKWLIDIKGSFTGTMGLPAEETLALLKKRGVI